MEKRIGIGRGGHPFRWRRDGKGVHPFLRIFALIVVLGALSPVIEGCGYFVKPRGRPLSVHATAPDFSLSDASGRQISLHSVLEQGPVVLVFYRGHW